MGERVFILDIETCIHQCIRR